MSQYRSQETNIVYKKFHIITMGCQMNEYDSDHLSQTLQNAGHLPVVHPKDADFIMINTCAVRAKAEQKAFSMMGRLMSFKRKRPTVILGIMGCIAQQKGSNLLERFPELDLILGTRQVDRVADLLQRLSEQGDRIVATDLESPLPDALDFHSLCTDRIKSFISIMEGCDNFCTYCIVPYVRGRERSRAPLAIIREAKNLLFHGIKEITLLGQNVNSYCYNTANQQIVRFPALLRQINSLEGLKRIRFTTSHPKDLSNELIQCFEELQHLCPHIHLPLQSGSNSILKAMQRGYTREYYMELIVKLRKIKPEIAVSSDIMVGFPGETDEDFELTLELLRAVEFDNLFSFKYSDREGTAAEKMPMKIPDSVQSQRLYELQEMQKRITLKKNNALIASKVEVLVEGLGKRDSQLTGRTASNKIVNFKGNLDMIGQLLFVTIKKAGVNSLLGEI